MVLQSMTGFARVSGEMDGFTWGWEVKSVNGKGLDIRARVPAMLDGLDIAVKKRVASRLARGNVTAGLQVTREAGSSIRIDKAALKALFDAGAAIAKDVGSAPPAIDQLMTVRGIVELGDAEIDEATRKTLSSVVMAGLDDVLAALQSARREEGAALAGVFDDVLNEIERLVTEAAATASAQPDQIKSRLKERISDLLGDDNRLSDERLDQEVALLALKADVREEIDRLNAHIASAREMLAADEPVGRRLDFLAQEFNREANTLCSKSPATDLTNIGLALKAAIDQFREQIQNIE